MERVLCIKEGKGTYLKEAGRDDGEEWEVDALIREDGKGDIA